LVALEVAMQSNAPDSVILQLIEMCLPVDPITREPVNPDTHGYVWVNIVQSDSNKRFVEQILSKHMNIAMDLANSEDSNGRVAVNIAR
jgi:hypothetical protein